LALDLVGIADELMNQLKLRC